MDSHDERKGASGRVGWWQGFNDWQRGSLAEVVADSDDHERRRRLRRAQLRRAWPWFVWLLVVAGLGMVVMPAHAPLLLRIAVGLLVVPPMVALGYLRMQLIGRMDELERRIEYQAMAITFVLTLCTLLGVTLLQQMHVPLFHVSPLAVFWLFFGVYLLACRYLRRRYR